MNNLYLIAGASGSGKTTIANMLEEKYGYRQLQSYTTRPPRSQNETGHIFITDVEFDNLQDIIAYTDYNNYRYCATAEQANNSDVYVIDPAGIDYLKTHYKGKPIKIINITSPVHTKINRMEQRGDAFNKIMERLLNDIDFRDFVGNFNITNDDDTNLDELVDKVHNWIEQQEKGLE